MFKDEGDSAGQVLASKLRIRAVDDREPVDAGPSQVQTVREGVVHGGNVGKASARAYHGKGRRHIARPLGSEVEEPRVGERWIGCLLGVRIDVVEDCPSRRAL